MWPEALELLSLKLRYKRHRLEVEIDHEAIAAIEDRMKPHLERIEQIEIDMQPHMAQLEDIGASYAWTLRAWRERFTAKLDRVRQLGYPDAFIRMFQWYFVYCEGGFIERSIGDVQMLFAKPRNRRVQYLPDLRNSV